MSLQKEVAVFSANRLLFGGIIISVYVFKKNKKNKI